LKPKNLRVHAEDEECNKVPASICVHAPYGGDRHPDGAKNPGIAKVLVQPTLPADELAGQSKDYCTNADEKESVAEHGMKDYEGGKI
jgi:hypothetical protein